MNVDVATFTIKLTLFSQILTTCGFNTATSVLQHDVKLNRLPCYHTSRVSLRTETRVGYHLTLMYIVKTGFLQPSDITVLLSYYGHFQSKVPTYGTNCQLTSHLHWHSVFRQHLKTFLFHRSYPNVLI